MILLGLIFSIPFPMLAYIPAESSTVCDFFDTLLLHDA